MAGEAICPKLHFAYPPPPPLYTAYLPTRLPACLQNYIGRRDEFRARAIDRAVLALQGLAWPLRSPGDVEQLGLGQKTTGKVGEAGAYTYTVYGTG